LDCASFQRLRDTHSFETGLTPAKRQNTGPDNAKRGDLIVDPVAYADQLHRDADELLVGRGIDSLLRSHGQVFYTGSYAMDLMAWPDIDIVMMLEPGLRSVTDFFGIGRQIAQLDGVLSMSFRNCLRERPEGLPEGLYWGARLKTKSQPAPWKIDLWATTQANFQDNQAFVDRVRAALDEEKRRRILEIKQSLITPEGRTPVLSGLHIYEAVLFNGLWSDEEVRTYLRGQGIEGI